MNARKSFLFLVVFVTICFSANCVKAQSLVGKTDNYAGSQSLSLNPSAMSVSYLYADFGLNVGVTGYNNYFFYRSFDMVKTVFDSTYKVKYTKDVSGLPRLFDVDFKYGSTKPVNMNVSTDINIFNGMYNIDGRHSIGFFIRNRSNVGVENLSAKMIEMFVVGTHHNYKASETYLNKDTTVYYNQYVGDYENKDVNVGIMEWSEIGLSYSQIVVDVPGGDLSVGANLKFALGHAAMAMALDKFDFSVKSDDDGVINDSLLYVNAAKGSVAYSLPLSYDKAFVGGGVVSDKASDYFRGFGCGIDVGLTYIHKRNNAVSRRISRVCESQPIDYDWKIGLSLLDLGAVKFTSNAEQSRYDATQKIINKNSFDNVKSFHAMIDSVNVALGSTRENQAFWMGMPTSLSLQFDYSFNQNFYLNAVVIQPIRFMKYHASREAQLMVAPRYESRLFDVSLPVTLVNYERVLLGASFRVAFLTIGTQNLLNLIGVGNAYGLDVYVALKFNFNKGRCFSSHDACWNGDFGSRISRKK